MIRKKKATVNEIKNFFQEPNEENKPIKYAVTIEQSKYLAKVIEKLFPNRDTSILELGSNVGRNIYYLYNSGYHNIYGIEGSKLYYKEINRFFPEIKGRTYLGQIEKLLNNNSLIINKFELIFTMAVLEHIPHEIELQVFNGIVNRTNYLLVIEDEKCNQWKHFPRDYKEVFEKLNMNQIGVWTFPPLGNNFVMRLFRRK